MFDITHTSGVVVEEVRMGRKGKRTKAAGKELAKKKREKKKASVVTKGKKR